MAIKPSFEDKEFTQGGHILLYTAFYSTFGQQREFLEGAIAKVSFDSTRATGVGFVGLEVALSVCQARL
jgi:hypothetical protein